MPVEQVIIAVAGTVAVSLYAVALVQIKRAFPKQGNWLITQVVLTAVGATAAAASQGYGPVMWTVAPASVALTCFAAGKGSVAVLIHETDEESGDKTPMPEATAKARKRFGVMLTVAIVVFIVGGTAVDLFEG
jgi:hypothetical protein